jgi:hypothetical protein
MTEYSGPNDPRFIKLSRHRVRMVLEALQRNDGNVAKSAFELGVSMSTVIIIIQKEGLKPDLLEIRQSAKIRKLEEKRFRRYSPASVRGF